MVALSADRERDFSTAVESARRCQLGQAEEGASRSWSAAPATGTEIGALARLTGFPLSLYSDIAIAHAPGRQPWEATQAPAPEPAFRRRPSAPVRTLLRIFERWGIGPGDAATMLGADTPELIAGLRSGVATLRTRDMQDRARLILDIYEGLFSLFRGPQAEAAWLREPLKALEGQSIFGLMTEGSMANLMVARDFVDYLNGR